MGATYRRWAHLVLGTRPHDQMHWWGGSVCSDPASLIPKGVTRGGLIMFLSFIYLVQYMRMDWIINIYHWVGKITCGHERKIVILGCTLSTREILTSEFFFFFFFSFYLYIYFWLCCIFVALCKCSLVAAIITLWLRCPGFSLWWLPLLWSMDSRCLGFSHCGAWA